MTDIDLVITNGKLVTFDPTRPSAEALAVKDGRIAAVDIVVMQQDLHAVPGEDLDRARPALTLCGGRITFEA